MIRSTCQFCGKHDPVFAEDTEAMDSHYFNDCPMLSACSACGQVVEISSLNDHLLTECEKKPAFRACPRCREAIKAPDFKAHTQKKTCAGTTTVYVSVISIYL